MKPLWSVPKIWSGDCFILGGGPSLQGMDVGRLGGSNVIAVNNAYKLAPWAGAMFFGDRRWLQLYGGGLDTFKGFKITTAPEHLDTPDIHVLRRRDRPQGISTDPTWITWNRSSGACAINLAYLFGATRIILLGFDMHAHDGRRNFHDDYPTPRRNPPYSAFLEPFPAMAKDCRRLGVQVLNATPDSSIKVWPIVHPEFIMPILPEERQQSHAQ